MACARTGVAELTGHHGNELPAVTAVIQGELEYTVRIGERLAMLRDGNGHLRALACGARIELANRGFSCSAVRHIAQQQSDVVNPLTSEPLNGEAACVLLSATATEAEIFSTAFLAMGHERTIQYLARNSACDLKVGWIEANAEPFLKWINVREI